MIRFISISIALFSALTLTFVSPIQANAPAFTYLEQAPQTEPRLVIFEAFLNPG